MAALIAKGSNDDDDVFDDFFYLGPICSQARLIGLWVSGKEECWFSSV
jgi:hypothetical protein